MHICIHTHIITVMTKEAIDFKKSKEGYMGRLGGMKGKGEIMQLYFNLQN